MVIIGLMKNRSRIPNQPFFPLFEVAASDYFEQGLKIGKAAQRQIQLGLKRRKKWLKELEDFSDQDPVGRFDVFLYLAHESFPQYLDELHGIAQGAEVPFHILFILNLNPELGAMMRLSREEDCSTVLARVGDRLLLGHDEDGSEHYLGLMYLLRVKAPSGISFLALSYPGIIHGNGPGINSKGIVHTCNYLGGKKWRHGVPRYFIDRAMLEARSMKEAIKFASHPGRAFSQAHNLISLWEKRAVMIEASVDKVSIKEVKGVVPRTNHFLLPPMKNEPQFSAYQKNSLPRFEALQAELKGIEPKKISPDQIVHALSSHQNRPVSPCRHKSPKVPGATLGTMLFDSAVPDLKFFFQMPCKNIFKKFPRPI